MKEIIRENIINLPYSLHDAHINKITMNESTLMFMFDEGYYEPKNGDNLPIQGYIKFDNVDLDYCSIFILNTDGNCKTFMCKEYEVMDFIKDYPSIDMEIIDETYGFNQSKFSGYIYQGESIQKFIVEIYHIGCMKYILQ